MQFRADCGMLGGVMDQHPSSIEQLTSDTFCSTTLGIDKSSTASSSAFATNGDIVEIAAMEASEVFRKAALSQGDDDDSTP